MNDFKLHFIEGNILTPIMKRNDLLLFTWFSKCIEEIGIANYLKELIDLLVKIGAHDYAIIEKKHGEEMWRMFVALEK